MNTYFVLCLLCSLQLKVRLSNVEQWYCDAQLQQLKTVLTRTRPHTNDVGDEAMEGMTQRQSFAVECLQEPEYVEHIQN